MSKLVLAIPSKGRLMEQTVEHFAAAGLRFHRFGEGRGYRGTVVDVENAEVRFISAGEIAHLLRSGEAHLGVTGEDLVRETMIDAEQRVAILQRLDFGHADVVVAVPACWIDVRAIGDLEAIADAFRRVHGRRLRVATKYTNLARRFFAGHGVTSYRIVESLGATEGTVAAGSADIVVDITSTGETLRANGLKLLDDGRILSSEACLVASKMAEWTPLIRQTENEIMARLGL
jgi:ATP phosphoribosyltransferase